jgi:hypothetical protein
MKRSKVLLIFFAVICLLLSVYCATIAFQASWLSAFSGADVSRLKVQFWSSVAGAATLFLFSVYLGLKATERSK